ncbi:hypothetical protein ACHAO9_011900 [Fusarium lateritium]
MVCLSSSVISEGAELLGFVPKSRCDLPPHVCSATTSGNRLLTIQDIFGELQIFKDESPILELLEGKGGRVTNVIGLNDEMINFLAIHGESQIDNVLHFHVQYVGYSSNEADMRWTPEGMVYACCPEIVHKWLYRDHHFH